MNPDYPKGNQVSYKNETSKARMIGLYRRLTDNYALKCHDAFLK